MSRITTYDRNSDVSLLTFGFALICITPFMSIWRQGPLSSFYLESGSLLFALILVLTSALAGKMNVRLPANSVYFLLLAAFWWAQARIMALPFPGVSDMAVWSFAVIALLAWACRGWVVSVGQDKVGAVLAWALVVGSLLQSVVCILQFGGWSDHFSGYILTSSANNVMGQLAQRNHLGHYLMWGVISAAYLWAQKRVPDWLGAVLVVYLAATLGMVNSRTLFIYIFMLALLVLFWRWRAGKEAARMMWVMLFALAMVVLVQLSFDKLMALLQIDYVSAIDRVSSRPTDSPRVVERNRAWIVFLAAPIWGHGWQSYSEQGFLVNTFVTGWRYDSASVLFTHSHNIILQLLTEMGSIGTLLVLGGFVWVLSGYLKRPLSQTSLLPLALLTVTLCHSMLEYPLWYVYFLVPFGIMLSLQPVGGEKAVAARITDRHSAAVVRWGAALVSVFLITGIVRLAFVYSELVKFDTVLKTDTPQQVAEKIDGLLRIERSEPMLRYYAQLSLNRRASPADPVIQPWAVRAAEQAMVFRPYANAHTVGLYLYRNGEKEAGSRWMRRMYEYYPSQMPYYATVIDANQSFKDLRPQLDEACAQYAKVNPEQKCPAPAANSQIK
ncbi:Wzy polymerase domain-containing protein [Neisseria sp.]|uniref:PglL family O-oligosaccharyltransferase n=1 Tax=Neisseria sp. TaxID=192066 RepID=UPI00289D812A|nr:Wzy polymerase domain-containing protein [Neisseria sp.]